jgi:hypothetical protein
LPQRKHYTSAVKKAPEDDAASSNAAPTPGGAQTCSETLKIDKDAKTVETAVGDLPLSPVMDPMFWEARERFKQKKPRPGRPGNALERELRKNPFGKSNSLLLMMMP